MPTHRLNAAKFDPSTFISVDVSRPFGIDLEEVELDKPRGVVVGGLAEDGNAAATKSIYKGLFLVSVAGVDVKFADFDQILTIIGSQPEDSPVTLQFVNPNDVFKGKALINVTSVKGDKFIIETLKGMNLREVLLQNDLDVYQGGARLTNCGGGGSCGTCVVAITNAVDWDPRPEWESKKLKKYSDVVRLACNTFVEGDCNVLVGPPKTD